MKGNIARSVVLSIFLAANYLAPAQTFSIDEDLIWKTSGYRNVVTGEKSNQEGIFESSPDSIIWTHGRVKESLPVLIKQDSWPDINESGGSTFSVVRNRLPGRIVFKGKAGEWLITMEFVQDNVNTTPYEFIVSRVTKN